MTAAIQHLKIQYFLLFWFILNIIQATFMELHVDEAYYWVYSQFLDWGYYDHPPMIAVFIRLGNIMTHSTFGVRLLTVIANTCAVYFLWKIVEPYFKNAWLFSCLYFSFVIFHPFGFITSPDSPLFFFATAYLYLLQRYIKETEHTKTTILLALVVTGLLYSKYHAVLLLLFTFVGDWKLLKRKSTWLIFIIVCILYVPHIVWQIQNDYPSIQYHLLERTNRLYKLSYTTDFLTSILLVTGPLTSWMIFYLFFKSKSQNDSFIRILKSIFWGFMLFFLLSTSKNNVQAQWVLMAYIPLFILGYINLAKLQPAKWFYTLLYSTAGLIIILRLVLIIPIPPLQKIHFINAYWGHQDLALSIKEKAGNRYVIFDNGFQDASSYNYTTNSTKGFAYDSRSYRKTQYDYWSIEDSLRNKDVYFVRPHSFDQSQQDTISTALKGTWYGIAVDHIRTYQKVNIICENIPDTLIRDQVYPLTLTIINPYDEVVSFDNTGAKWPVYLEYGYVQYMWTEGTYSEIQENYHSITIPAKSSVQFKVSIKAPAELGSRSLLFSLRTSPFAGARNSKKYPIYVAEK